MIDPRERPPAPIAARHVAAPLPPPSRPGSPRRVQQAVERVLRQVLERRRRRCRRRAPGGGRRCRWCACRRGVRPRRPPAHPRPRCSGPAARRAWRPRAGRRRARACRAAPPRPTRAPGRSVPSPSTSTSVSMLAGGADEATACFQPASCSRSSHRPHPGQRLDAALAHHRAVGRFLRRRRSARSRPRRRAITEKPPHDRVVALSEERRELGVRERDSPRPRARHAT